jgi:hypothetical protein
LRDRTAATQAMPAAALRRAVVRRPSSSPSASARPAANMKSLVYFDCFASACMLGSAQTNSKRSTPPDREWSAVDGKRSSKEDEIEELKAGKSVFSSVRNTVHEVRLYGEVAIALGENHSKGSENGCRIPIAKYRDENHLTPKAIDFGSQR